MVSVLCWLLYHIETDGFSYKVMLYCFLLEFGCVGEMMGYIWDDQVSSVELEKRAETLAWH